MELMWKAMFNISNALKNKNTIFFCILVVAVVCASVLIERSKIKYCCHTMNLMKFEIMDGYSCYYALLV